LNITVSGESLEVLNYMSSIIWNITFPSVFYYFFHFFQQKVSICLVRPNSDTRLYTKSCQGDFEAHHWKEGKKRIFLSGLPLL